MSVAVKSDHGGSILKRLIAAVAGLLLVYFITLAQLPDRDKMFDTALSPVEVVQGFYSLAIGQQNLQEAKHKYVSPDVLDHGPLNIDVFYSGTVAAQGASPAGWPVNPADNLVVSGDVVVARYRLAQAGNAQSFYVIETFKVLAGSIVERWSVRHPEV